MVPKSVDKDYSKTIAMKIRKISFGKIAIHSKSIASRNTEE